MHGKLVHACCSSSVDLPSCPHLQVHVMSSDLTIPEFLYSHSSRHSVSCAAVAAYCRRSCPARCAATAAATALLVHSSLQIDAVSDSRHE
jgi:hypothetical protein